MEPLAADKTPPAADLIQQLLDDQDQYAPSAMRRVDLIRQKHEAGKPLTADEQMFLRTLRSAIDSGISFGEQMVQAERTILAAVLEMTGWNVKRAAATLGMPRSTLQEKVARLNPTAKDAALAREPDIGMAELRSLRRFAKEIGEFPAFLEALDIKLARQKPILGSAKLEIHRLRKRIESLTKAAQDLDGRLSRTLGV